ASSSTAISSPAPTGSRANGATTRSPGRSRTNFLARTATAASKAASRTSSPGRAWGSCVRSRPQKSVHVEPVETRTDFALALSPEEIVARAEQGDTACEPSLQTDENRLARSLAHVINILDPDVIVLGGGMSNIARLYANVPALWGE